MKPEETKEIWEGIIEIYKEGGNPSQTMDKIFCQFEEKAVKEAFATVAAIKKNDGRIYGENRKFMDSIPVNPDAVVWDNRNPMIYADLDYIHTANINVLITELRMRVNQKTTHMSELYQTVLRYIENEPEECGEALENVYAELHNLKVSLEEYLGKSGT